MTFCASSASFIITPAAATDLPLGLCSHNESLQWLSCSWNCWWGAGWCYTTHPWTLSESVPSLWLSGRNWASQPCREGLDSHIPKHLVLSPPQVLHHVLLIWSSHSSTLHTSTQFPCHSPILWGAQCFLGDAEPPLPPACLKTGNAQPPPWLSLFKFSRHCNFNMTKALVERVVIVMAALSSLALNCFQIMDLILSYLQFLI